MLLATIRSFRVCFSHQSARTNQGVVFVLWFERCSNFNKVMPDSERAVRKMESSFKQFWQNWHLFFIIYLIVCQASCHFAAVEADAKNVAGSVAAWNNRTSSACSDVSDQVFSGC